MTGHSTRFAAWRKITARQKNHQAVAAIALAGFLFVGAPAAAQTLNFGSAGGPDLPIEIFADSGIEWQQENLVFIARGNAKAVRGDVTVYADELRAYYREKPGGGSEITRLDAVGKVRIVSPTQQGFGEHAVYDVDSAILVLTGGRVRFVSENDVITADKQLEYWEEKQMAVARGNAQATREEKKVNADVLAAYFRKDADGKNKIFRVDAFDAVKIATPTETAIGDRGVYNVESGIATLTGSVKIERQDNVLTGCRTEVNLNTGISKLFACPRDRVRGVLLPKDSKPKARGSQKQ